MKKLSLIIILSVVVVGVLFSLFHYREAREGTAVDVYERSYYVLKGGNDSLFCAVTPKGLVVVAMSDDTTFMNDITCRRRASWVNTHLWPSCSGRIAARKDSALVTEVELSSDSCRSLLMRFVERQNEIHKKLSHQKSEMEYFIHVHGVQDEGYDVVARRMDYVTTKVDSVARLRDMCQNLLSAKSLLLYKRYEASLSNVSKPSEETTLERIESEREGYDMWQTRNHKTPSSAAPVYLHVPLLYGPGTIGWGDEKPDTLTDVLRDIYAGERDKNGRPSGSGVLCTSDGDAYEGHWLAGKRNGIGVGFSDVVRSGSWKDDKYLGESLLYSQDRIYGIDISRHQHEKGKKRYGIDWKALRITSLGSMTKRKVSGIVDYPVSFVYIKSTEGKTVYNKYYASDYKQAHKYGYRVGTYHFFSTKTPAIQQARFFLRKSCYRHGDMPPVLDVEPSEAQIRKLGGSAALMRCMKVWLDAVEHAWHVRPVIYVSQTFIRKHLSKDMKDNYCVWIARYGEYKPDVHMVYWQLSPDGRVRGITPAVDINVFNGYQSAFDEFTMQK